MQLQKNGTGSGTAGTAVEPAYEDRPKIFFGAPLQTTKTEIICKFWYFSKTKTITGWAKIKLQGDSTARWPKKNQSVKLYKDEACTEKLKINFKGWGEQYKFVIKAYWNDITHIRDIVSVRLESDCARTRSDYAEMPEELRTSPNMGAVDGFPVMVWANGVYQGRYMWNIPKDKWMNNMDDELESHCMLMSEGYPASCLFRGTAKIDGTDWTDEIHDTVPASIKTRWNEVISFVMNSTDEEFRANLGNYINVNSLIDRHLMGLYSCDYDGYGKNQRYDTYDGQLWYAVPYDKDGTWGGYWDGSRILPSNYGREQYEDFTSSNSDGSGNLLFIRLEQVFYPEMQDRWPVLKAGPLSVANTINRARELYDITPPYVIEEDYASTTASGAFTGIPNKATCTIQQIQTFVVERHAWMDEYIASLTPAIPVPCTGITLDKSTLTFSAEGTQTLTATVTPDGCTDSVTWESNNTSVATVSGGVVTAIANGSTTITAKCGEHSASCSVSVSGIVEPIPCTGITLSETELALKGVTEHTLIATVTPDGCTDAVTWESSNTSIVAVSDGVITVKGYGDAVITARCGNHSATCSVSVDAGAPLYPLADGTVTTDNGIRTMAISDGNHAKYTVGIMWQQTYANLHNINRNIEAATLRSGATNEYSSTRFTLKAGDVVTLTKKNTVVTTTAEDATYSAACMISLATKSGELKIISSNFKTDADATETKTITADYEVEGLVMWSSFISSVTLEFDVELHVNGIRYV